jgi:hypothetical protein
VPDHPPTPRSLAELRGAVRRPASLAVRLTARPEPALVETLAGGVRVGLSGEIWPVDADGQPMIGVAQLNLLEAPFVPVVLHGIAALAVFLAADGDGLAIPDGPPGPSWRIRTYATTDGLVPLAPPPASLARAARANTATRPRRIAWRRIEDVPAYEDLLNVVDSEALERLLDGAELEDALGSPAAGIKIGGWPALLQGELGRADDPSRPSTFCLQIDADEDGVGFQPWDGALFIGRRVDADPGDPDGWTVEAQLL